MRLHASLNSVSFMGIKPPTMKHLYLLLLFYGWQFCGAQNLVPNPSFEEYDTCPNFDGQISRAIGWYSTRATPDYFNTCAPGYNWCTVPINYFGYRTPASGNAYAGVIVREGVSNARENIGIQLLTPLEQGLKYYASFKVSLAGQANVSNWCGVNKLGVLLSNSNFSPSPICDNCAQICNDSIVVDTLNWTRITGSFIADSNYSFISIGRFNVNTLTDSIQLDGTACNAYYYIDDVCLSSDSAYSYNYDYTTVMDDTFHPIILIYPNPTSDFVHIELPVLKELYEVQIFDGIGREVYFKQNAAQPIEHIPIEKIEGNMFLIRIKVNEKIFSYKLLKLEK